jgi:hypothetical protein
MVNLQVESVNPKCRKLIHKLTSSGRKTLEMFKSVEGDDWYQQVYSEGANWSVYHILAHFVASEASIVRLIKIILQGSEGVPDGFDIDAFNEREVNCFSKLPNDLIMQRFLERREETIQLLLELSDSDLLIEGRHPWLGVASIEEMVKLLYRHNLIHQRDIRKVLVY